MQFTDVAVYVIIPIFSLLGIALFAMVYFGNSFSLISEVNSAQLVVAYEQLYEKEELLQEKMWKTELPAYMVTYFQTMEIAVWDLYWNSVIFVILTCVGLLVGIASWLTPQGSFWGFLIAFIWGALVCCLLAYFYFTTKLGTLFRMPVKASFQKEDVLKWGYGNGFILAMLFAAVIMLNLLFVALVMKALAIIKISPSHFAIEMLGYPMGMLVAAVYFREGLSMTGRGIQVACDLIVKKDQFLSDIGNNMSYTSKVATIMSSVLSDVNYFDSMVLICLYMTAPFIIMVNSEDYTAGANFLGNMMGIPLIFVLNWLAGLASSFLVCSFEDQDTVTFTAKNMRFQILISTAFSFIFMLLMLFATPNTFEYGLSSTPLLYMEKVMKPKMMGCGFLGIICSSGLLIYYELLTSHGYQTVQKISASAENAPTLNVMHAYYIGYMGVFIPAIVIGFSSLLAYELCSLPGLIALCTGYIMNMLILMPIQFFGQMSADGLKCAFLAQVQGAIIERLHSITWAARIYTVWLKITHIELFSILSMALLGDAVFFTSSDLVRLNGYNLFGLMVGSALGYFNKGLTIYLVKQLAEDAIYDERAMQSRKNKDDAPEAMENFSYVYFPLKHRSANYYVLVNLLIVIMVFEIECSVSIIFSGILFGHGAVLALGVGNLITVSLNMLSAVLVGSSLKSARIYNSYDERLQANSQILASNLYADIQGYSIEDSQNIPQPLYLVFNMMLILMGVQSFKSLEG